MMRGALVWAVAVGALLVAPLAVAPAATDAAVAPRLAWSVVLEPGQAPRLVPGPADGGGAGSSCLVFVPLELACTGDEVPINGSLRFIIGFDLESASNSFVHLQQQVGGKTVFTFNCKSPYAAWVVLALVVFQPECSSYGVPAFDVPMRVKFSVDYLPAAGELAAGGWSGTIEPL